MSKDKSAENKNLGWCECLVRQRLTKLIIELLHFIFSSEHIHQMVESSKNYLWDLRDKIGSDATSDVYKARNFTTGEVVLAKVSKLPPVLSNIQSTDKTTVEKTSIFDREIKNINHDNIVRFIDTELVIYSDNSNALLNQEVLFIEYCNGGTIGDMLRSPANRYGLTEDIIMQIMKDIINAIKYLHNKNIIHLDIKPDNIMQSIDINGKATFKLTDLGVARQIQPDEQIPASIHGTEQDAYRSVYSEIFPDVDMWSFGVTLYQCCTGRIPFQLYDGIQRDRDTMRQILTSIPKGCISGVQNTYDGEIQWSKVLPEWCRLSLNLKEMLEKLLSRLFETTQDRLMKHEEFFDETDRIINLIPIYYLNLKKFTLTCAYFPADYSIDKFFDRIRQENGDAINVEYRYLFQNVHYPLSKSERISMKTFCEQLPCLSSREEPLVIYTFSSLKFDEKCIAKMDISEIQPMKNIGESFSSVYVWSQNITGLFFYVKNQLIEYEFIMKITESSIMSIHRVLQSKLLELLCSIRAKRLDYQALDELERIVELIGLKNNSISTVDQPSIETNNNERSSAIPIRSYHKSIIKSADINKKSSLETISSSLEQQNLSEIKLILHSSSDFNHKLIEYDQKLSAITRTYFSDQVEITNDPQGLSHILHLSKQINNYSMHIRQINKYAQDASNLSERFRQDTMINKSSSLQMTSNVLRQKHLKELHDACIHFINERCYPLILEIFNTYTKMIKQQADINCDLERIQFSYEHQCRKNISIDHFRQIINDKLQKFSNLGSPLLSDRLSVVNPQQLRTTDADENPKKIVINKIHVIMQKTIEQAKHNSNMLDDIIKRFQQPIVNNTLN